MSCFIMKNESLAALADTLEYIGNFGFNRFGFEFPASLHKALSDCRDRHNSYVSRLIFQRLYSLNCAAYAGRYTDTAADILPDMPRVSAITEPRQYANYHETLLPWHYKFCKLLDCLIYQITEDATINDPLRLALVDFSVSYKSFLVSNTAEYAAAPWGCI